ncbi:IucA/IucC family C-terminal-domain containing protein [Bacillus sp. REN10]|uniref:IucA/IucC family C-terminal-domain containing protein n=1 Tax=Bacillus sp. REN10 TaxID=2782541 RepID=UPI00193B645D|nr:IucA/IucC family C-terminal-domain containing protein [Bacillus sp. REN10]
MTLHTYGVLLGDEATGIPLTNLTDEVVLRPIIKRYADYLETSSLAVAGSLFLKRYAVVTAAACLDYYGLQQRMDDWWSSARFLADEFTVQACQTTKTLPCEWHELVLLHMHEVVEQVAQLGKVPRSILWENVAVRLNAVFQRQMTNYPFEQLCAVQRVLANWQVEGKSPLQPYLYVHELGESQPRKTCCRYYQLTKKEEGMPYCLVCPLQQ